MIQGNEIVDSKEIQDRLENKGIIYATFYHEDLRIWVVKIVKRPVVLYFTK